ncbi:endo alpha-1,4 polygalactosaminidase [Cerasicoccus fimbriatus]|uniref:endo alpha-1,4 polygalactosaminidase n=1 Tax=Cerasicoccus fimbriatus TaxID=3014554 RepID=UPI0022B46118|nr:endo alpha-1,4 polygalactosaminidase [Cerasicoccus sp. TK19100]
MRQLITFAAFGVACLSHASDVRDRFERINSYACYYGPGMVEELVSRDAVIIETKKQSPLAIAQMQDGGAIVIGYISIGEDDVLRVGDGQGPGGMDSGYFDRDANGEPDKNKIWNSYYADARQPAWRKYFLERTAAMRDEYGVDGFFLDTVDTSELYPESKDAMISLIQELRAQQPDSVIVINRGFHTIPALSETIDGVMFESGTASYDFAAKEYMLLKPSAWDYGLALWRDVLKPAMDEHGLVVLALDYAASAKHENTRIAMDRATTFGYVPEVSTIYLDAIYDIDYTPSPDERFLELQNTPERMTYQLPEPVNGFPEGTRVAPSSIYPDYDVTPVVDGIADRQQLDWRRRAWASWEKDGEHFLEFQFPQPVAAEGLTVNWAFDNGVHHQAREFRVEVIPADQADGWVPVASVGDNQQPSNDLKFDPVDIVAIRLVQEDGMGSLARPDLMWVEQVTLKSRK